MVHKDYVNKLTNYHLDDVHTHEPEEKFFMQIPGKKFNSLVSP
jgi:hypothetical protein